MISASAQWTDEERFVGQASSGHAIVVDAGEKKVANSPMELVLIGLCGCTASDVVSILKKKRQAFTAVEVRAEAERAEEVPRVYTQIKLLYRVRERWSGRRWRTRCGYRRRSTARCRRCWRRRRKFRARSN